ncbi:MAG: hypothetical protein PPP58_06750 [Natronomonas sp.]
MAETHRLDPADDTDLLHSPVYKPDEEETPTFEGEGPTEGESTFVCFDEDCSFPVFKGIDTTKINGVVAQCGGCGEYNRLSE